MFLLFKPSNGILYGSPSGLLRAGIWKELHNVSSLFFLFLPFICWSGGKVAKKQSVDEKNNVGFPQEEQIQVKNTKFLFTIY